MTTETSINVLMREIVERTAEKNGNNISFLFGDWAYIASQLTIWGKSRVSSKLKYPIVCLYSPYMEERTGTERRTELEFIILVNSRKEYTNEERETESFEGVLRPVYRLFVDEIMRDKRIVSPYDGIIQHLYRENYRYGRLGVLGEDGKPFGDFIDAIEIKQMKLTIKELSCYGTIPKVSRFSNVQHG